MLGCEVGRMPRCGTTVMQRFINMGSRSAGWGGVASEGKSYMPLNVIFAIRSQTIMHTCAVLS